jgi:hypothetical protein
VKRPTRADLHAELRAAAERALATTDEEAFASLESLAGLVLDRLDPPCRECKSVDYTFSSLEEIHDAGSRVVRDWFCDPCWTKIRSSR